jgi:hypothetical protein
MATPECLGDHGRSVPQTAARPDKEQPMANQSSSNKGKPSGGQRHQQQSRQQQQDNLNREAGLEMPPPRSQSGDGASAPAGMAGGGSGMPSSASPTAASGLSQVAGPEGGAPMHGDPDERRAQAEADRKAREFRNEADDRNRQQGGAARQNKDE